MTVLEIDSPVTLAYDPYSEESLRDPTELHRALRKHLPAYPLPQYNAWALSRFDDIWEVCQDRSAVVMDIGPVYEPAQLTLSNNGKAPVSQPFEGNNLSFSQLDPPVQTDIRRAINSPMLPSAIARMEGEIRALANKRLDELIPQGRFDVYADYGGTISSYVMCRLVGLPAEQAAVVQDLVNKGVARKPPGADPHGQQQRQALHELLLGVVKAQRETDRPQPAIDGLLGLTINGQPLNDDQVAIQLGTIVTGGTETVPKVVARCLLELSRRPDQLAAVRSNLKENCKKAFEEMMRFGAPLQYVGRTAARDMIVGGGHIRKGQRIFLLLPSANRDEREFSRPDEFIWNRTMKRHLAFGYGVHFCIGAHVARLEGKVLLEEFLARVHSYEIDEENSLMPPSDFQIGYIQMPLIVN